MDSSGLPPKIVGIAQRAARSARRAPRLLQIETLPTPIGDLVLVADADGRLCNVDWGDCGQRQRRLLDRYLGRGRYRLEAAAQISIAATALRAYFAGDLAAIDGLAVDPGGTPFQQQAWSALRGIPAGATIRYADLAHRIGRPQASRAAGHANALNPISVVLPCHRVVGSNGALTGYGGGLARKQWLLQHEGVPGRRAVATD